MANRKLGSIKNTDVVIITSVDLASEVGASVLPVANGGTGQSSFTDGQILIGNSSGNTLTKASLTAGANVTITPGAGSITIAATGGSGSPGGSDTQVQFNDGGSAFGGDAGLTFNKTTNTLTVTSTDHEQDVFVSLGAFDKNLLLSGRFRLRETAPDGAILTLSSLSSVGRIIIQAGSLDDNRNYIQFITQGVGRLLVGYDGVVNVSSTLSVGTAGLATGAVQLKGTTSGVVTIQPADAAGTYTLTLPTTDGDPNQFLQTNGSGVLTWATGGSAGFPVGTDSIDNGASPFTATTNNVILADASSGAITINLPAVASSTDKAYLIKKTDSSSNAVTIDGNASETINGATTMVLSFQHSAVLVVCNGSEWNVF